MGRTGSKSKSLPGIHYVITNMNDKDNLEFYEKLIVDWKTLTTITSSSLVTTSALYPGETVSSTYFEAL